MMPDDRVSAHRILRGQCVLMQLSSWTNRRRRGVINLSACTDGTLDHDPMAAKRDGARPNVMNGQLPRPDFGRALSRRSTARSKASTGQPASDGPWTLLCPWCTAAVIVVRPIRASLHRPSRKCSDC
jgi:hypothetical protein